MLENPKKKEGIEYGRVAQEPETKRRDLIRARCRRTRNKAKGLNLSAIPENPKQNEGIESGRDAREPNQNKGIKSRRDAREPETKGRDRLWAQC